MAALEAAGVPCARYRDPGAALTDPHLLARGAFATIADGAGEAAHGPVTAAIANAVFDCLGIRIRQLPITRDSLIAAMEQS